MWQFDTVWTQEVCPPVPHSRSYNDIAAYIKMVLYFIQSKTLLKKVWQIQITQLHRNHLQKNGTILETHKKNEKVFYPIGIIKKPFREKTPWKNILSCPNSGTVAATLERCQTFISQRRWSTTCKSSRKWAQTWISMVKRWGILVALCEKVRLFSAKIIVCQNKMHITYTYQCITLKENISSF